MAIFEYFVIKAKRKRKVIAEETFFEFPNDYQIEQVIEKYKADSAEIAKSFVVEKLPFE